MYQLSTILYKKAKRCRTESTPFYKIIKSELILKLQLLQLPYNLLLSFIEQQLFIMPEIFLTSVAADKVSTVVVDGKLGYENQHLLTFLENLLTEKECIRQLFVREDWPYPSYTTTINYVKLSRLNQLNYPPDIIR